jgi:glycosyltransferase involved in cell wall biosynthesis
MKVSIITVCKNSQDTIERTIKSVVSQTCKDIEYLIIDGKSSDKTLGIVNKYKNNIDIIISKPDKGLYYAMNKGIERSSGDIIYFLNSGDLLFDKNTVLKIIKIFKSRKSDIVYGDVAFYNPHNLNKLILRRQNCVDRFFLGHGTISHQSIFTRRNLFEKFGKFDTQYKLAADYEWILRLFVKNRISSSYTNQTITKYLRGGLSSNSEIDGLKERLKILPLYYSFCEIVLNGLLVWFIYRLEKKIKRDWFSKG